MAGTWIASFQVFGAIVAVQWAKDEVFISGSDIYLVMLHSWKGVRGRKIKGREGR